MSAYLQQAKMLTAPGYQRSAIRRAAMRGDPGIFSGLGKALSFVGKTAAGFLTGGVGGAVAAAGSQIVSSSGKPLNPSVNLATLPPIARQFVAASQQPSRQIGLVNIQGAPAPGLPSAAPFGPSAPSGGGTDWTPGGGGTPCQRGYHYNKVGYYTKRYGWIEKGTVCVKNRRRNPLNPRALSRAMARLTSAKKASEGIGRISIRQRPCR